MAAIRKSPAHKTDWLLWLVGAVAVVSLIGFGVYYYNDRYVHADEKVMDRQARQVEDMVKKNPQNPDLRVGVADFYLQNGSVDQAIEQAQEALKIKADHPGALIILGRAFTKKGDTAQALQYYNRYIELAKDAPLAGLDRNLESVYYEVGMIQYGAGSYPEASEALQNALKIDDTDADALYSLGMVYQKQNDHENAVKQFEEALRFDPLYSPPYEALAASFKALGKPEDEAYARAMLLLTQKNYGDAAAQLEALTKQNPDMVKAFYGLGVAYQQLGKFDRAQAALEKYVSANPNDIAGQDALNQVTKEAQP